MSRDLRFRAWVIAKNCYMEVVSIEFFTNKVILKRNWNKANNEPTMKTVPLDDVILEQYTGLTDKNGKKIYEGDIVNWDGGIYEVFWHQKYSCFHLHLLTNPRFDGEHPYNELGEKKIPYMEVIGNVHENPELLEGEK